MRPRAGYQSVCLGVSSQEEAGRSDPLQDVPIDSAGRATWDFTILAATSFTSTTGPNCGATSDGGLIKAKTSSSSCLVLTSSSAEQATHAKRNRVEPFARLILERAIS